MSSVRNFAAAGTKAFLRNNAVLDASIYKFGTASIKFDGNANSYVRSNEKFTLTNTDWCLEFWVNLSAQQTNSLSRIVQLSTDLPDQYGPGHVSLTVDSGLKLVVYDYNIATPLISTTENLLGVGWKHVAVSRQGSTWRLFLDGVQIGTATWADSVIGTNSWFIGGHPFSQTGINGWVDDVRFTLNKARYVSSFIPESSQLATSGLSLTIDDQYISNVALLLPFDQSIDDVSGNVDTPIVSGNVELSALQSKFGGYSASFNGASHLAYTVPNGLGSGNFTLEFWYYKTANSGMIFNSRTAGIAGDGIDISHDLNTTTDSVVIFQDTSVATNTWTHVAIVRSGSTLTRYINGIANGSNTSAANFSGSAFKVGGSPAGNVGYLSGYIEDFRSTNGVARYLTNFTPPGALTIAGTTDGQFDNVSLRLALDGIDFSTTIVDNSTNNFTPTVVGNTVLRTNIFKFGSSSLYLDGSLDYLSFSENSKFAMGAGAFTMEAWIYPTAYNGNSTGAIFGQAFDNDPGLLGYGVNLCITANGVRAIINSRSTNSWDSGNVVISLNQWYHVAVNRTEAGITTLFVNGIAYGSATNTTTCVENRLLIGSYFIDNPGRSGFHYAGYIDDVRITKGSARYSGNFLPPSTALPTSAGESDLDFNNVSVLLHMNGANGSTTFTDSSSYASVNTITVYGSAAVSTAQFKFNDTALYCDGSGAHIIVPHSNIFEFGSQPLTLECWIYPTSVNANGSGLLTTDNASNSTAGWWAFILNSDYSVRFTAQGSINYSTNPNTVTPNQWTHVAVCRVGNTFSTYINGVLSATDFDDANTIFPANTNNAPVRIGARLFGASQVSYGFVGYIDEVRITKGIARYTANFTPKTTAFADTATSNRDSLFTDVKLLLLANNYVDPPGRDLGIAPRLSTFTPDWPVKVKPQQGAIRLNNVTFGGKGRIYGTVKIKGIPNLPVSRRVRLFTDKEGAMLAETWSDPVTGDYEFLGFDPAAQYTVLAYDYQQNFRAVVADNLTPEAYNP